MVLVATQGSGKWWIVPQQLCVLFILWLWGEFIEEDAQRKQVLNVIQGELQSQLYREHLQNKAQDWKGCRFCKQVSEAH